MQRRLFIALLAAMLVPAACGGGEGGNNEAEAPAPPAAATTGGATQGGQGDATAGEEVFTSAGCGACHALMAAGSSGRFGPDLDMLRPSVVQTVEKVRSGGGGMPSFKDQLTEQEIEDVAAFVAESAQG